MPHYGIVAVAWLGVARALVVMLALLTVVGGYVPPDWKDGSYKLVWQRLKPLVASSAYFKTGPILDKFLSSMAGVGALSLIHFGLQIYDAVGQVIFRAVTSPMVPTLAGYADKHAWRDYRKAYRQRLSVAASLSAALYAAFLIGGIWLFRLFVGHGKFDERDAVELWYLLVALGGYLVAGAMGQILSSAFYAKGDTLVPARVGSVGFTLGAALKVLGLIKFGIVGIAAAASVHQIFNTLVMFGIIEQRLKRRLQSTSNLVET